MNTVSTIYIGGQDVFVLFVADGVGVAVVVGGVGVGATDVMTTGVVGTLEVVTGYKGKQISDL